ncbi:MAG TPA: thymidine kinase [Pyrinomonadaceae bacterium]|nr:thymidine kinase [Pyrinomonadaceae bacterium]
MEELTAHASDEHLSRLHKRAGWIEVIAGSMFSGKSEELIRRLRRAKIARQRVQVFKPDIDDRYSRDHIVSHSEMRHESSAVRTADEIRALFLPETEVVGVDEGQFFDADLVNVANELAYSGVRVIVAGLDQDYTGRPFGPMPALLAVAEYITKTHAICVRCGEPANYSQRIIEAEGQVVVGASDAYEARCRRCFVPHADRPTVHPD